MINGGVDRIDTSFEELRADVQERLCTAKSKDEYVSHCKAILQEIARRPDCDKFLGVHETGKTLIYDFTPELIMEVQESIEEEILKARKINTSVMNEADKKVAIDQREMEQEQGEIKE